MVDIHHARMRQSDIEQVHAFPMNIGDLDLMVRGQVILKSCVHDNLKDVT